MSELRASGCRLFTDDRLALEKDRKADMGRLGARGSFDTRLVLAGTFQGPVYIDFSISYRALSCRAISSHFSRSSSDKAFQACETILATSVVGSFPSHLAANSARISLCLVVEKNI